MCLQKLLTLLKEVYFSPEVELFKIFIYEGLVHVSYACSDLSIQ